MATYLQKLTLLLSSDKAKDRKRARSLMRTFTKGSGKLRTKSKKWISRRYNKKKIEKTKKVARGETCYFVKDLYKGSTKTSFFSWEANAGGKDEQTTLFMDCVDDLIYWFEDANYNFTSMKLNEYEVGETANKCSVRVLLRGSEYADATREFKRILERREWEF